jgi:putative oxidoreductase
MKTGGITPLPGWAIAIMRVVVGIVFLMHGGQKLFVWGFRGFAAFMGGVGIPAPMLAAVVVTLVECVGGLGLVLGLFTRWLAIPLAIDMLVAIFAVHLRGGFFLPNGYEFALTFLAANATLACLGSGGKSVDNLLAGRQA